MKVLDEHRGRSKAFRPSSVVNVSGMSYGSLSSRAIEALNRGCAIAGCSQSTAESGLSPYHLHGGELVNHLVDLGSLVNATCRTRLYSVEWK